VDFPLRNLLQVEFPLKIQRTKSKWIRDGNRRVFVKSIRFDTSEDISANFDDSKIRVKSVIHFNIFFDVRSTSSNWDNEKQSKYFFLFLSWRSCSARQTEIMKSIWNIVSFFVMAILFGGKLCEYVCSQKLKVVHRARHKTWRHPEQLTAGWETFSRKLTKRLHQDMYKRSNRMTFQSHFHSRKTKLDKPQHDTVEMRFASTSPATHCHRHHFFLERRLRRWSHRLHRLAQRIAQYATIGPQNHGYRKCSAFVCVTCGNSF